MSGPGGAVIPAIPFLYLRHGETDWNRTGRAQGRADIPLNALGRAQAEAAGRRLAGERVERIVASPLGRARETALIVAAAIGAAAPVYDDDLREVSFGVEEGRPMGPWYEQWLAGAATPDGGEPFDALGRRAARALVRHLRPEHATLFVAHGALFRALRAVLGQSVRVRLANAVPVSCRPDGVGWAFEVLAVD